VNRLASETSPYLLQHAGNPVDWYPWGEEAFARAQAEDRPILLSVGYAACHWCHVMEHESFEDEETAALMNERFVPVKVDREERPDVDGLYMEAVVSMTGQGGWPMTVFLTPDGRPFWGGTYFPPEPRPGLPSFREVLLAIDQAYRERRDDLEQQADDLVDALRASGDRRPASEPLTTGLLAGAVIALEDQFDPEHGGFGGAPKFPPASTIEFLLREHARTGNEIPLAMARKTLDRMAAGGVYDQLGGGFHRYAVDAIWLVPHFEKMLYDNALLASAYLHAWVVSGDEDYRRVVEETLDYLVRDLRLPAGGFASAQDADTLGEEGLTYVWTPDEIRALLPPAEADALIARYGITRDGNFEGRSILYVSDPSTAVPSEARAALLAARMRRPQPLRDDKALAAWNGLTLAAFSEAARRLERPDYLDVATALAEFLLGPLSTSDGRLLRTYRDGEAKIDAYLEDYADVANGLLELYVATGELRWLEEARRLAGLVIDLFADEENGGFFVDAAPPAPPAPPSLPTAPGGATPPTHGLVVRRKEYDDHPVPSGNSMAAYVLLRLARTYGDDELERRAVGVFRLGLAYMERLPHAVGWMLSGLDFHFAPPREIALVGESAELRRAALDGFAPNTVFAFAHAEDDPALERVPLLAGKTLVDGRPAAYVCEGFACRAPVTEPAELISALGGG
jgi:uncharacterized protein YyaL (SSP411 family)